MSDICFSVVACLWTCDAVREVMSGDIAALLFPVSRMLVCESVVVGCMFSSLHVCMSHHSRMCVCKYLAYVCFGASGETTPQQHLQHSERVGG